MAASRVLVAELDGGNRSTLAFVIGEGTEAERVFLALLDLDPFQIGVALGDSIVGATGARTHLRARVGTWIVLCKRRVVEGLSRHKCRATLSAAGELVVGVAERADRALLDRRPSALLTTLLEVVVHAAVRVKDASTSRTGSRLHRSATLAAAEHLVIGVADGGLIAMLDRLPSAMAAALLEVVVVVAAVGLGDADGSRISLHGPIPTFAVLPAIAKVDDSALLRVGADDVALPLVWGLVRVAVLHDVAFAAGCTSLALIFGGGEERQGREKQRHELEDPHNCGVADGGSCDVWSEVER